jgi:hypothetical protein
LPVAEVGRCLGNLTEGVSAPQTNRNRLLAQSAIALSIRIVAEVSVDVEVPIGDRWIANEGLVGRASDLGPAEGGARTTPFALDNYLLS